jgi:hypothetical protein
LRHRFNRSMNGPRRLVSDRACHRGRCKGPRTATSVDSCRGQGGWLPFRSPGRIGSGTLARELPSDIYEETSVKTGARRSRDYPGIYSASSAIAERHERERGCSLLTPLIESTPAVCAHMTFDASVRSDPTRASSVTVHGCCGGDGQHWCVSRGEILRERRRAVSSFLIRRRSCGHLLRNARLVARGHAREGRGGHRIRAAYVRIRG